MTNDELIRQIFDELLTEISQQNSSKFGKISQSSSKFVTVRQNFVNIRQDLVKIRRKIRHEIGFYSDE